MASTTSLRIAKQLWNWEPHSEGQLQWIAETAKVKIAACGRRWGKSESTAVDIVLFAIENPHSQQFVVAPTDDQTKVIVEEVSRRLHSIPGLVPQIREVRSPYHSIALIDSVALQSNTYIAGRTAGTDGKGLRGHKAHRVIVDEAAYVGGTVRDEVISPILADYDGQLVAISTPKGRNWFWRDFLIGLDSSQDRIRSYQFPSAQNPYLPAAYLEYEKTKLPDRSYRQEYLAEFLEDAGGVFRGVTDVVCAGLTARGPQGSCVLGVDLARINDFTVLTALDEHGNQVYFDRFNQISWERQIAAIVEVARRFDALVLIDSTGVGDPIFEAVRKTGTPIQAYQFTSASKERLIDNLAMLIEQQKVSLLDIPVQTSELQAYEYEITPSRNVRMNAPEGMHDDCVIALALAGWLLSGRAFSIDDYNDYND